MTRTSIKTEPPYGPAVGQSIDEFAVLPIRGVKITTGFCTGCFSSMEKDVCDICSGSRREATSVCVDESPRDGVKEFVMATVPTLNGDGTALFGNALFITNQLENDSVEIPRLARRVASGSVLEFSNREMLADALFGRHEF